MNLDLKSLNADLILKLPVRQKLLILGGVMVLLAFGFYWVLYSKKSDELVRLNKTLAKVEGDVRQHQAMVEQLAKVREEVDRLNARLTDALAKLPQSADIPSLLVNITNLGKESALAFASFQPKGEVPKTFYAEVPIDIALSGNYHDFATFLDKLARMPRIVNASNLEMGEAKPAGGRTAVTVRFVATTYRFLEQKAAEASVGPSAPGAPGVKK